MKREIRGDKIKELCEELNSKGYKKYKALYSYSFSFPQFKMTFEKVQGDPFAPPSYVSLELKLNMNKFRTLGSCWEKPFEDFCSRLLYSSLKKRSKKVGTGNSGFLGIPKPSPRILRRSSSEVSGNSLRLRFFVGLPGKGRKIDGKSLEILLCKKIPDSILEVKEKIEEFEEKILEHIQLYQDQEYIREFLDKNGFSCFVRDGAILPRESSISEKPLENAKKFLSPKSLRIKIELPSGKKISGMALPKGISLITGGGYHGKTTLLKAIQEGVYDHVKGDGREYVISLKRTVTIKAEDGRMISNVDISNVISQLPSGIDTSDFSTMAASGSTSMASSINEAIELGAENLLIDEDTSATNMMYKDEGMEKIIRKESIRVLSSFVRSMSERSNCNVILIMSSSSSFFYCSDCVVLMEEYSPKEVTENAKKVAIPTKQLEFKLPRNRIFSGLKGPRKIKAKGFKLVIDYPFGKFELDLKRFERIVESGQVKTIAKILRRIKSYEGMSMREISEKIDEEMEKGFSSFCDRIPPDLTEISGFDVIWTLNRLPGLRCRLVRGLRDPLYVSGPFFSLFKP